MWSSKLISLSLCLFLVACGFQPLYTPMGENANISYPIKIATIANREGQLLRNDLIDLLTPEGQPAHPQYILEVTLTEVIRDTGINKDETTNRKEAILNANIILRNKKTQAIVYQHTTKAINSFSVISQNYYSDLVAQEFAKKEATHLLAQKITLLVTNFLDTQQ
ncbi:MAG: hypothetical protein JSR85_01760 [Proteobacteria bacterium]|nr:hypothetical protein [Pseudomonadota bacterium]